MRIYPAREVAANMVGFLGTPRKDGSARALAGLEDTFDGYLSGMDGEARYEVGRGQPDPARRQHGDPAIDGADLTITIDSDLQWYAQRVLRQTVVGARGESGIAVIMDSRTGEMLALADYPTYDASEPQDAAEARLQVGGADRRLRARLGGEGAHPQRAHRRRQGQTRTQFRRARGAQPAGPADPRLLGARHEHLTLAGILAKSSNIGTVLAADEFGPGSCGAT